MLNKSMDTPVLFVVYRRPETTAKVLEAIRKAGVRKLFVAADAPNPKNPDDVPKCSRVREIIQEIDWDCEVKTLFRTRHLSCRESIASAINWFFESVEEGIILEDDCLPHSTFFPFCQELLRKYRNDDRIFMISGHNAMDQWDSPYSYVISKIGSIWGWATWKRAWMHYDYDIRLYTKAVEENVFNDIFRDPVQAEYRKLTVESVLSHTVDSWDYGWTFTRLINSGLSLVSSRNLISNIGFGKDGTHTKDSSDIFSHQPFFDVQVPLKHPFFLVPNASFDNAVFNKTANYHGSRKFTLKRLLDSLSYRTGLPLCK